ncbi:hypothetical protein SAMN02745945_01797 [Peptoclostridium litorale DSM 5388]|uniref:Uncharacterized protein n=1 Tax=Peptoclostridium litorale DSM 5388 TaxID=1121324 RepID=A0A069RIF5_PEPLI|nr:hypothetical protein [Peptoclostridium litorale]KDR95930.1 hypothetical protein CLIT_8c00990 [Peptoclostridium litorale DSM 5388]SIO09770.1 hypothetical protein SAMN02745945_01797 [Peptoclostridium litorale DSM 5388]
MDLDARLMRAQKKLDSIVGIFGLGHEKTMRQSKAVDRLIVLKMQNEMKLKAAGGR